MAGCPRAVAMCSDVARPRLARKVDAPWSQLEELAAALPEDASLLVPEGTSNGEVWLDIAGTYTAWLLAELERRKPRRLVVAHGATVGGDDLADRLATLVRARL